MEYTIAAVSKLTGVSCHTLRIWERRYGFPTPLRSLSGHRRYAENDVQKLLEICERVRSGEPIRHVLQFTDRAKRNELAAIPVIGNGFPAIRDPNGNPSENEDEHEKELQRANDADVDADADADAPEPAPAVWRSGRERYLKEAGELVDALIAGNTDAGHRWYDAHQAKETAPVDMLRFIECAFVDVGERWYRGQCAIFQEHLATQFLRIKLGLLYHQLEAQPKPESQPLMLLATMQGERHEGGLFMIGIVIQLMGWRTLMLGCDLPTSELAEAIALWKPQSLGLSFALSRSLRKRFHELQPFVKTLPIFLGGRSILNHQKMARDHHLIPLVGSSFEIAEYISEAYRQFYALTPTQPDTPV